MLQLLLKCAAGEERAVHSTTWHVEDARVRPWLKLIKGKVRGKITVRETTESYCQSDFTMWVYLDHNPDALEGSIICPDKGHHAMC